MTINMNKRKFVAYATSLFAVLAAVVGVLSITIFKKPDLPDVIFPGPHERILHIRVLEHERTINNIKAKLDVLTKLDTTTDVGAQTTLIRSDLAALDARIQILEDGLLENPEKALSIPLMRKDIQKIEHSHQENSKAMTQNINRVYDQNKWLIGLMFTGLISLAVSSFIQVRKKP